VGVWILPPAQKVTLRLIAERLLPPDYGEMYVEGEVVMRARKKLLPPNRQWHVVRDWRSNSRAEHALTLLC
jgi:hypothetical protein